MSKPPNGETPPSITKGKGAGGMGFKKTLYFIKNL